jgi:hypothetical protein
VAGEAGRRQIQRDQEGVQFGDSTTLCKEVKEMFKTHSWRTASLMMALTLLVGLAFPALGDDWLPFRGHYAHDGAAPGSGQATHLGRFIYESMVVVNPADGSAEGPAVFTAANGDQLFVKVDGAPTNECGSTTTEVRLICGTFTVTEGTGRFSDASGERHILGELLRPIPPVLLISLLHSRAPSSTERRTAQRASGADSEPHHTRWPQTALYAPFRRVEAASHRV